MRYIRLYEEFVQFQNEIEVDMPVTLSDKTIDDVLDDRFFDEIKDEESNIKNKIISIPNWNAY